jgi:hypothetical protein
VEAGDLLMGIDLRALATVNNLLPLAPAPFAQGLTAEDFAARHQEHGEPFRYWHALEKKGANKNGKSYEEAVLGGSARGLFHSTRQEIETADFGRLPVGSTQFSCLPEVVEITAGGRLLRSAGQQARIGRATITRGSGAIDVLPHRFVSEIVRVVWGEATVATELYEAASAASPDDADRGGIRWLGGAPAAGAVLLVEYRYQPFYLCLGDGMQSEPIGADGALLPQRVLLREEK